MKLACVQTLFVLVATITDVLIDKHVVKSTAVVAEHASTRPHTRYCVVH